MSFNLKIRDDKLDKIEAKALTFESFDLNNEVLSIEHKAPLYSNPNDGHDIPNEFIVSLQDNADLNK